ncbi:alpha/beta hydrolase-fold protein [soil metagenome]
MTRAIIAAFHRPPDDGYAMILRTATIVIATLLAVAQAHAQAPAHRLVMVTLASSATAPVSGRLLLFVVPLAYAKEQAKGHDVTEADIDQFDPGPAQFSALEVEGLAPGKSVAVDTDGIVFPAGLSTLPAGDYLMQAVLDTDHSYPYEGRGPGDILSKVVPITLGNDKALPELTLEKAVPPSQPWQVSERMPPAVRQALKDAQAVAKPLDFVSPRLTAFWGRPIHMRGWILTPPGYDPKGSARYPTVYWTHGFTARLNNLTHEAAYVNAAMVKGQMPPMIWIFLDESFPSGTHEFADSVNNGPWGAALTEELIPSLEQQYRMDGNANGRFLNGHSSGGWASLWLQTRYPKIFGGTWSTAPDPVDFREFAHGASLYGNNVYRLADNSPVAFMRDMGGFGLEASARLERALGPIGGQLASFDWVFSPRGDDGRAMPVFDRDTGAVDPVVAQYWRDNYDISWRIKRDWSTLAPDLDGKIHLIVGTADTFYLDDAVRLLEARMKEVGAKTDFRYLEGRTHGDLYKVGDDRQGLLKTIAWEMYKVARPQSKRPG